MIKAIKMKCRYCGEQFVFKFENDDDVVRNHRAGWPCSKCLARQIINGMSIEQVRDRISDFVSHFDLFLDDMGKGVDYYGDISTR